MVEWQNKDMDVDAYVARDLTPNDDVVNGTIVCGYEGDGTHSIPGGGGVGATTYYVDQYGYYFDDPQGLVNLERDIVVSDPSDQPRVETVSITGASAGLETLRYYIRLFNQAGDTSLTGYPGASAEATVFVMQGSNHLGTFNIAVNSQEYVLGVLQMKWSSVGSAWTIASYSNPVFDSGDGTGLTGVRSISNGMAVVSEIK
jgi:hypothetical protein